MNKSTSGELEEMPGVGKKFASYLRGIGLRSVRDLKGKSPEKLYDKLCERKGKRIDRCVLYGLRCAVYYASNKKHNPKLLKWWNWKD
jgi:nucleotidyltransferase/DNA polymerase involved in DNA repair